MSKVLDEDGVILLATDIKTLSDATYEPKKLIFTNKTVTTNDFASSSVYASFPYKGTIALTGVTDTMFPELVFDINDAISGNYAPVAETYNGGVYIYSTQIPSSDVLIPTIICYGV